MKDRNAFKTGQIVEVIEEDKLRRNNPKYSFCGRGKRGQVIHVKKFFREGPIVIYFGENFMNKIRYWNRFFLNITPFIGTAP